VNLPEKRIEIFESQKNRVGRVVTCPPKTGPDFVREIWHNLRPKSGGEYESEAVHHGEDYRDAA
jgi:hypothetical protein